MATTKPSATVATFPLARLKYAARLRKLADDLATSESLAGDAFLVYLDRDGVIHTDWLLGSDRNRHLRMVGILDLVRVQLLDVLSRCGCEDHDA